VVPNYNPSQITYALRLSRCILRILVGLLTGRADLNRHLALINVKSDALCPLCQEEEESSLHFPDKCNANIRNSTQTTRLVLYGLQRPRKSSMVFSCEVCQDL